MRIIASSIVLMWFVIFTIMTLPVYSENDPNIFDDLDGEPESIDYFVEKGFEIYTLNDMLLIDIWIH